MERKGCHNFVVNNLILRLNVLFEIFGRDRFEKKVEKSTINKWFYGTNPSKKTLRSFCEQIGMTITEFQSPLNEFSESILNVIKRLPEHNKMSGLYSKEQIESIIKKHEETDRDVERSISLPFFKHSLDYMGKHGVRNEFIQLEGCYYAYFYWTKKKLLRFYIEVVEYDEESNVIKCKMTSDRGNYHGVIISIDTKMFWMMECLADGSRSYPELFIFIIYKPFKKFNYPLLHGIVAGGSRVEAKKISTPSIPCASRLVMKRLNEVPEKIEVGYLSLEELKTFEPQDYNNILKSIDNKINNSDEILLTSFP